MLTEHSLTIDFDTSVTVSDIMGENTLDTSVLKQDDINTPVREHVNEAEAVDEREYEIHAIEEFVARHGVTKPTEVDFTPKKYSWGGKSKAEQLAKNPDYVERRGRPRTLHAKKMSFTQLDNGLYKRSGRGRVKKGHKRHNFTIHFSKYDIARDGTHSHDALLAMATL